MKKAIGAFLTVALLAVPTEGSTAPSGCRPYEPRRAPRTDATNAADALKNPAIRITDAATADDPVVVKFQHGPGKVFPFHQGEPLINEARYFNFQVDARAPRTLVSFRAEWPTPSVSDIDVYLYSGGGNQVAASESSNTPVEEAVGSSGGPGFESISDVPWPDCGGITLESQGSLTAGESMTLKIWLERI